jgi:hypothetical protein
MAISILIGLPAYRHQIDSQSTRSLMHICGMLGFNRVAFDSKTISEGTAEARNLIASYFLHKTSYTHLLQVDSDMVFNVTALQRCIDANVDVIGCIAPVRTTKSHSVNVVNFRDAGNGIGLCDRVGTGIMLAKRTVFERLASDPATRRTDNHHYLDAHPHPLHGFFDESWGERGRISEDYSFCDRWRAAGGLVHAIGGEDIGHVGRIVIRHAQP